MCSEILNNIREKALSELTQKKCEINVCMGTACLSNGSKAIYDKLLQKAQENGNVCQVRCVGCRGLCARGPLVGITDTQKQISTLEDAKIEQTDNIYRLSFCQHEEPSEFPLKKIDRSSPFFTKQTKIVLEQSGYVNPDSIEDYVLKGGYATLEKVLREKTPEEVIDILLKSGLRGRGGAGFPTGMKWKFLHDAKSKTGEKYLICNGDEGDPGAFMDRSIMEADPHRILEGLAIGAYATGATKCFIYVRAEYPLAVTRLKKAIQQARKYRLLGKNILDTNFSLDIEIRLGAGAFVCGEETALIASIEGKRGNPSPRPPFPTQSGLWGQPTAINNVETLANIVPILSRGAEWFAGIGFGKSRGTKVFALTGHVNHSGLIEVPMGTTIREIVFDIGGGIPNGKKFKAIQTGGPSGGVIPEQFLDTPISYETLQELGSIMGSGGMLVMDEDDSMVDVAKFYLKFCVDESCGKCSPCRIGGYQMLQILEKITRGRGTMEDLDRLQTLGLAMQKASLCGLGQTAPNPVLSTLRYFRNEYIAYIEGGYSYAKMMKEKLANKK